MPVLIRHGVLHEVVLRARAAVGQQPDAPMDEEVQQDPMDDLRLRIWVETTYSDAMDRWFLKHRHELESWIFSCLRVPEDLAAELFLQLTDDGADLAVLTDRHAIGKERWTRGVVGPVRVSKVAEPLRQVLRWNMFEADLNANAGRICHRISSGEAIALEATLAELSWQRQKGVFPLPPAAP